MKKLSVVVPVNHRVSSDKKDKDFVRNPGKYKVYFNRELVKDCIDADPINGKITVLVRDEEGKLVIIGEGNEKEVKTEEKFGNVKVWLTKEKKIK